MGRTVLPARWQFEAELDDLRRFRDALRAEDREHYELLMLSARKHISAISYAGSINTWEPIMLCMLIEMEKRLQALENNIKRIENSAKQQAPLG
ncbi:MAG: hypothetical protein ABIJ21_09140 [Nanoarchaeota archaeon]